MEGFNGTRPPLPLGPVLDLGLSLGLPRPGAVGGVGGVGGTRVADPLQNTPRRVSAGVRLSARPCATRKAVQGAEEPEGESEVYVE